VRQINSKVVQFHSTEDVYVSMDYLTGIVSYPSLKPPELN